MWYKRGYYNEAAIALCKKSNDDNVNVGVGATSLKDKTQSILLPYTMMSSNDNMPYTHQDHSMLQIVTSVIEMGLESVLSSRGLESFPSVGHGLGNYLDVTQSCSFTNNNTANDVFPSSSLSQL